MPLIPVGQADSRYPTILRERLQHRERPKLRALGNLDLLGLQKTALFCSARTPGEAILRAHDAAARLRDKGTTVISGFHSPIERECLRILLRGKQPIIVCPARALETMRIPSECRAAFAAGRLLYLSPFINQPKRVTKDSALCRNELVAALADEVFVAYVAPGGQTERIAKMLHQWGVRFISCDHAS